MPNMPLYVEKEDVELILSWLREDPDIAVIVDCGAGEGNKRKWRAISPPTSLKDGSYWIWHIPSGPIVRCGEKRKDPDWIEINKPFDGYEAFPYATHLELQNIGNKPQFVEFEIKVHEKENPELVGLSNFSWIGSYYEKAPEPAKKWWGELRRFIAKNSTKINGNGINSHEDSKFPCFPNAYERINQKK